MATPGVTLSEKYFHEFTFAEILSNVRWLLVAFPSKAPRFHPVFFLPSLFFAGAVTKKKRFFSAVRIKKSVPVPAVRNRDWFQSPGWILIVVIFFILE